MMSSGFSRQSTSARRLRKRGRGAECGTGFERGVLLKPGGSGLDSSMPLHLQHVPGSDKTNDRHWGPDRDLQGAHPLEIHFLGTDLLREALVEGRADEPACPFFSILAVAVREGPVSRPGCGGVDECISDVQDQG